MKKYFLILFLLCLFVQSSSQASFTICPDQVTQKPNYQRAWQYLKRLKPRFTYDNCQIEVHICDINTGSQVSDDLIGDILIKNQKGETQYIPLIFPLEQTSRTKSRIDGGETWVSYWYLDFNKDDEDGLFQKNDLDIVGSADGKNMKRISSAVYTSTNHDHILGIIPISKLSICEQGPSQGPAPAPHMLRPRD